jgi:hypothetical protein
MKRSAVSALCILTTLVTAYYALRLMFGSVNGGPRLWWPWLMLGASILLLVGGVHLVIPRVCPFVPFLGAPVIPLLLCLGLLGHVVVRCWLFAGAILLGTCVIECLIWVSRKPGLTLLITSLLLAGSWVPFSVNIWRGYFSPYPQVLDPRVLVVSYAPWLLMLACIGVSIGELRQRE